MPIIKNLCSSYITQEEIDFYKLYFPDYTEEDIKNMLYQSYLVACLLDYESQMGL